LALKILKMRYPLVLFVSFLCFGISAQSTLKKNIFSLSIIDDALQDFKYKGISNGLSYERHLKGPHSLVAGINVCKNLDKTDDISFFIPRMEKAIGFKAYLQHKHYLKRKQVLLHIVNNCAR
jgi:hypothetical protein